MQMIFISGLFISESPELDSSKNSFCIKRKIAVHHPRIVIGIISEYLRDRFALVPPEIKYLDTVFIKNDPAGKIDIIIESAVESELLNIVIQIIVHVKLGL